MNILIDAGHPAHVHYFRYLARDLENNGHKVFWSVKKIPMALSLLDSFGFEYYVLPKKADSLPGKIFKQLIFTLKLLNFCRKKKVNLILGFSVTAAHISLVTHIKSFIFDDDDDDIQPLITKFVTPFCTELLSPDSLKLKRKRKDTIFYPGYHELAYLHPKRFIPDPSVLLDTGLQPDETFFILRFNTFRAHHDRGKMGFSFDQKIQLIKKLKSKGRIFISAERTLEPELEKYKLTTPPEKIHSLMAYTTLFISDSQTMTSEAAVLGIPSLRCNSIAGRRAYLSEEEDKFGLTFSFHLEEFDKLCQKIDELLEINNLKEEWQTRRLKMLECKIDVTAFWLWFIENYPKTKFELLNTEIFWKVFR